MIVYKDLISCDEMMTDAFPQKPVVDSEGNTIEGMFEVRGTRTQRERKYSRKNALQFFNRTRVLLKKARISAWVWAWFAQWYRPTE